VNPAVVTMMLGTALGCGLVIIGRAVAGHPARLSSSLRRLDSVGISVAGLERGEIAPNRWHHIAARIGRLAPARLERDLAVAGRTLERHGIEKAVCAIALALIPPVVDVVLRFGGVTSPTGVAFLAALVGAAVGYVIPDFTLRSRATARRRAFRHALSAYLDLVNVLLAGGAGIETALSAAADAGDGWVFEELRAVLVRARATRTSPWTAFAALGHHLGIDELVELAASVELAGEQGARIRMSLVAKAEALRGRQAAEVEADAQAATERMGLPTVLMFLGFLILLGYPAAVTVVGGIGG
jgi:tight adherence protein C